MNTRSVPPRSAFVLAACALLVLAFAPAQYFGRQQDDVMYLVGARALASGRYCLLTSPGCPPLTMINPAWPALLAPLAWFTEKTGPFQAAAALLLALLPAALWAWLRRRTDETTALLAAALFASSPLVLSQAGTVMSEPLFTSALLAMLAASEAGRALPAGLAAAALLLTRTAGVAALPALVPFLNKRKPRDAVRAVLPPLLAFGAWSLWSWSRIHSVEKFDMFSLTYGANPAAKLAGVAASNVRYYAAEWGGCFLPPSLTSGPLALLLGAALAAAAARGFVLAVRRRRDDPAAWALAGTTFMFAVWGWQYERYLIPLLPLLLWTLALGLGRAAKPALGALLFLQLAAQTVPRLGRPGPWAEPELAKTYAWLAARPPSLIASAESVRDGWLSGQPSRSLPVVESDEEFVRVLKSSRVAYVLSVEGLDFGLENDATAAPRLELERIHRRLRDPKYFRVAHEEPGERAVVYEPK